jgi:SAM-dependent methyltransferase
MTDAKPDLPKPFVPGLIPTLNRRGFMIETLDPFSEEFAAFAGSIEGEALDLGCAYGVATFAALDAGAGVCACDMEQGHLDILWRRASAKQKKRLRCVVGLLPDMDFDDNAFGAILCSRVIHFLEGSDVERAVAKMFRWLTPGGKLFLITDTPYTSIWASGAPEYEKKKQEGDPWPGFIPDYSIYLPSDSDFKMDPQFLNPMDPDILTRVCEEAGLTVERAAFIAGFGKRGQNGDEARDHAAVTALKPHSTRSA